MPSTSWKKGVPFTFSALSLQANLSKVIPPSENRVRSPFSRGVWRRLTGRPINYGGKVISSFVGRRLAAGPGIRNPEGPLTSDPALHRDSPPYKLVNSDAANGSDSRSVQPRAASRCCRVYPQNREAWQHWCLTYLNTTSPRITTRKETAWGSLCADWYNFSSHS